MCGGGGDVFSILERKKLRLRKVTCPRSHMLRVAELAFKLTLSDTQALADLLQFYFLPNIMDSLRIL